MVSNPIKLKTNRATIESLIENSSTLKDSIWFKYLTDEAKQYCYKNSKPKTINEGEFLTPENNSNKLYFIISGEFYLLFKKNNSQKLIKSLSPGDFFSMRKDFQNIIVYPKKRSLVFVLEKEELMKTFSLSPQSKNLLKDFFIEIATELQNLNNLNK
jgi:hypothetical protein